MVSSTSSASSVTYNVLPLLSSCSSTTSHPHIDLACVMPSISLHLNICCAESCMLDEKLFDDGLTAQKEDVYPLFQIINMSVRGKIFSWTKQITIKMLIGLWLLAVGL